MISGLADFQVTYGVAGARFRGVEGAYPIKFLPADEVGNEGTIVNPSTGEIMPPWKRVLAVRVCVISKTYETAGVSLENNVWTDCNGNTHTSTDDTAIRKNYTQIFGVKNHLRVLY